MLSKNCNILIFGEAHNEAHTSLLLKHLTNLSRQMYPDDPISYLSEHDTQLNTSAIIQKLKQSLENRLEKIAKIEMEIKENTNLRNRLIEKGLGVGSIDSIIVQQKTKLISTQNLAYREKIEISYFSNLEKLSIEHKSIDMLEIEPQNTLTLTESVKNSLTNSNSIALRDYSMAYQIASSMDKNKLLIVKVGSLHVEGIIKNLYDQGVEPEQLSAYIIQSESLKKQDNELLKIYLQQAESATSDKEKDEFLNKAKRLTPYYSPEHQNVSQLVLKDNAEVKDYKETSGKILENLIVTSLSVKP